MKANELMIGDWVIRESHKNNPVQVLELYKQGTMLKLENGWCGEAIDLVEPIPLTPAILEKNGLINYETDVGIVRYSGNNIYIRGWMANCELYIGMIKYVHELQHALRLCGLTELADNFKV